MRLDEAALSRLRQLDPDGQLSVVQRVLQAFDESLSRQLLALASGRTQGDAVAVAQVAHLLKSSAASVGALALSACCTEVERRRRDGNAEGLDDDVHRMITEAERAQQAVRAMLQA